MPPPAPVKQTTFPSSLATASAPASRLVVVEPPCRPGPTVALKASSLKMPFGRSDHTNTGTSLASTDRTFPTRCGRQGPCPQGARPRHDRRRQAAAGGLRRIIERSTVPYSLRAHSVSSLCRPRGRWIAVFRESALPGRRSRRPPRRPPRGQALITVAFSGRRSGMVGLTVHGLDANVRPCIPARGEGDGSPRAAGYRAAPGPGCGRGRSSRPAAGRRRS